MKLVMTGLVVAVLSSGLFAQEPERRELRAERSERMAGREVEEDVGNREQFGTRLRELVEAGKLSREEAGELFQLAFPQPDKPRGRGQRFEVKDPAEFSKLQETVIFSGPQADEKMSAFTATGLNGEFDGKEFDPIAESHGKPQLLLFQDDSGVGFRGLAGFARAIAAIHEQENVELEACVIFLVDDPAALTESIRGLRDYLGDKIVMAVSKDGRDGPGHLGLNRNVAMTAVLAKDGTVSHNFAFAQPQLTADPHVLGGLADLIGTDRDTLSKWLNDNASPERQRRRMERK